MFDPWVGKIPWRRKWPPTAVVLPGRFHGQRSLAGYSPRGHKESDMTEHTIVGNGQPQNCHGAAGRVLHHMLMYYNEHIMRLKVCWESHLLPSWVCVHDKLFQSCPSLCNPIHYSLPRSLCPWDSPHKNSSVDSHFLLQGIFLT